MRTLTWAHGLLIVAALLGVSFAQTTAKPTAKAALGPPKPKLTEKQKQGLHLLEAAQAEAAALQPDMRAFIEYQASMGYLKYDPKKSDALLDSAFTSTTELTSTKTGNCWTGKDEPCRVKHWLQDEILDEMVKRSPSRGKDLALKVDPEMRSVLDYRLLRTYLDGKDLTRAKEVLDRMAGEDGYAYHEAAELMEAIPHTRQSERIAVFAQALGNFRQFNTVNYVDDGDFPAMLVRCWRELPPAMARDAIDTILEKAKDDAETNSDPVSIMSAHHGDIRFNSAYELRLFELLPMIRELDPSHADQLLRDHISLQETAKQFPDGILSIDPKFGHTWSEKDDTMPEILNMGEWGPDGQDELEQANMLQQQARIFEEASRDPKQALALALSLPELTSKGHHPRLSGLLTVADRTLKKDPEVCRDALAEIRKSLDNSKPIWATDQLLDVAEKYQTLGDVDDAKSTLLEASKSVEQLYKKDSDLEDPNLAFKGNWPSTQLWGKCLKLAAQISPPMVEQMMSDVPDPEIGSFLKIMLANGLLGTARSSRGRMVAEMHKDGKARYYGIRE